LAANLASGALQSTSGPRSFTLACMPELPEVESARLVIDSGAIGRPIEDVDDSDTYVCRPHQPGEIRSALLGRRLTSAHRQGKTMWCETSGVGRSRHLGPVLGIHLGMSGRIVFGEGNGQEIDGGDYWERGRAPGDHRFVRFSLTFASGAYLLLIDPRRLARVRLDPPIELLGPDAAEITRAQFREMMARGMIATKARLLDQHAIAGVGNLLADQSLWLAKINPARPVDELSRVEVDRLHRSLQETIRAAVADGGVHTLSMIPARTADGVCPRDGTPMQRGTVGGRTTWWCPREQI
jgi:formamidopyrimidine-DNA glycosylase